MITRHITLKLIFLELLKYIILYNKIILLHNFYMYTYIMWNLNDNFSFFYIII